MNPHNTVNVPLSGFIGGQRNHRTMNTLKNGKLKAEPILIEVKGQKYFENELHIFDLLKRIQ